MKKIWMVDDKFKELTAEEMKSLKEEQIPEYVTDLNEYRSQKAKEISELIDKNAKENEASIKELTEKLNKITETQLNQLNEAVKAQGLAITKLNKVITLDATEKNLSLKGQITKAFKDNEDMHTAWKDGTGKFKFDVKVAGTMLTTGITGGEVPVEDREPGLNRIARRRSFIVDLIARGSTTSRVVSWVEQQNPDGTTGGTTEGAAKNQIDFDLVVVNEDVKKRTNFIKISDEMLDDIDFIESEIRTELLELLDLDVDDQVLQGDGTGNNLNGIITQATAYSAGSFANQIDEANNWDVLKTAINQILIANHFPTSIVMHPSDITEMQLTKASDGQYIMPPFQSAEGMVVSGLPIVGNTGVTIDDFLVMDGTKSKVFVRDGVTIEMGFDADDFTKNLRTIRAETRLLNRIKGNDDTAFVTGTFAAAKTALETP